MLRIILKRTRGANVRIIKTFMHSPTLSRIISVAIRKKNLQDDKKWLMVTIVSATRIYLYISLYFNAIFHFFFVCVHSSFYTFSRTDLSVCFLRILFRFNMPVIRRVLYVIMILAHSPKTFYPFRCKVGYFCSILNIS